MFARRSKIVVGAQTVAETPLLVPSFSSKGFPEVRKIMNLMAEFITSPIIISSYDVHYDLIPKKITFPQLLFLDSGGYEARIEHDLSETYGKLHKPKPWNQRLHKRVLTSWSSRWPTIAVSFDTPAKFLRLSKQIDGATKLQKKYPHLLWELLIKPETAKDPFIPFEKLIKRVEHLRGFAVVGITEKELDDSLFGATTDFLGRMGLLGKADRLTQGQREERRAVRWGSFRSRGSGTSTTMPKGSGFGNGSA